MPYKDPFDDVVEVPYNYKRIYEVFIHSKKNLRYSYFKFRTKQQESNAYKFMNRSSIFQMRNQVQVMLNLLVWIITSKERFSTNEFVFDHEGSITLSNLEDNYVSRMNHLQEGENKKIVIRA